MSDYKGAALMLPALPKAKELLRRLVPRSPRKARHRRLHPIEIQSEGRHPL